MAESTMPPPKHGNGAFIGVAIVMLLGMGGLLFWKFSGKEDPPPEPPPVVTQKEEPPVLAEPPPPPPPIEEEVEKTEPKEEEPKTKRVVAKGPSGCSGTCSGEPPPALRRALSASAGMSRSCYEKALRTNALLQGKLLVSMRISPSGTVCSASVSSDSLGDPSVTACVLRNFRARTFPPPNGGCADVNVPISFQPKTQ